MRANFEGQNTKNIYNNYNQMFLPFLQELRASPHRDHQCRARTEWALGYYRKQTPLTSPRKAHYNHTTSLLPDTLITTKNITLVTPHVGEGTVKRATAGLSPQHQPRLLGSVCSSIKWPHDTSDHTGMEGAEAERHTAVHAVSSPSTHPPGVMVRIS